MPHGPFIMASYIIAALLLAWGALAPVIRTRRLRRELRTRMAIDNRPDQEDDHASST